jgi:hypothetical protein
MKLWICGRNIDKVTVGEVKNWDIHGVFSSEEKAVSACRDYSYFVGPVDLDEVLPEEVIAWPDSYYPKTSERPPKPEFPENITV